MRGNFPTTPPESDRFFTVEDLTPSTTFKALVDRVEADGQLEARILASCFPDEDKNLNTVEENPTTKMKHSNNVERPIWRTQGRALVLPNFINLVDAERVYAFANESMPAEWWSYAFHAPFATLLDIESNRSAIISNKKATLEEFAANRIAYRFRRTVGDHFLECSCPICETTLLFESDELLDHVSAVLGYGVDVNTSFMSYYGPGDFLSPHTDKNNGDVAFVWNLTKNWAPQYGGSLHIMTPNWAGVEDIVIPTFNTLTMFEVSGEGYPHFISAVAYGVKEKRLAFTGWFKKTEVRSYAFESRRAAAAAKALAVAPVVAPLSPKAEAVLEAGLESAKRGEIARGGDFTKYVHDGVPSVKHFYQNIPGTFMFREFYSRLVNDEARRAFDTHGRPMRFVEIGVYKGQSAAFFGVEAMLNLPTPMWPSIVLVDQGLRHHGGSIGQNLAPIADLVEAEWDEASVDCAKRYPDGHFDVVFIDADHEYSSVKADIAAWLPKVIPGGLICGHDFASQHPGVMKAVLEVFPSVHVERGQLWNEDQWKVVDDQPGEYIPVWWVRLPSDAITSVEKKFTQTTRNEVVPAITFPDLQALEKTLAETSNADVRYILERLRDRSNAFDKGYGTNVPLLAAVLAIAPPGDVLEIGAGNFSTTLLAEMCLAMGRTLVTVENNPEWAARFTDITDVVRLSEPTTEATNTASEGRWAVALVDQAGNYDRAASIEFLRTRADHIVVHDTHNDFFKGVDAKLTTFKYRYDYTAMCPATTVVSDTHPYNATLTRRIL